MLIKMMGCILIVSATTGFGYSKGLEYKRRILELEKLIRVIWHLKGEISYTKAALQEVCIKVARRVEAPYQEWLKSIAYRIGEKGYSGLGALWEAETRIHIPKKHLHVKDIEELVSLGYQMGYMDVKRQEETLRWYGEQIEEKRKRLAEKAEEKCRLCNCLGVMSGIFLAIILL